MGGAPAPDARLSTAPPGSCWSDTDQEARVEPGAAVMLALTDVGPVTVVPSAGQTLGLVGGGVPVRAGGGGGGSGIFPARFPWVGTAPSSAGCAPLPPP